MAILVADVNDNRRDKMKTKQFIFDLGAKFQVIKDDKWHTVATGIATNANAIRIAKAHNLKGIWIYDGMQRIYITV